MHGRNTLAWLAVGLVVVAVLGFVIASVLHSYYYPNMMPYYGRWWFFFPFGFIFLVFFVFFIGRLLFWPWGWRRGYWYHRDEAGEILRQRYARGEISKEQLDQMMRDLEQHA
jgi:uncharacterized membrane protein